MDSLVPLPQDGSMKMPTYMVVEKPKGKAALPPVILAAKRFSAAVLEVRMRFSSRDEAAFLYRMDPTGTIEMARAFTHDEPADELCVHCREAIERRDGEIVTKYGNDPQCDSSPNDNHRFA